MGDFYPSRLDAELIQGRQLRNLFRDLQKKQTSLQLNLLNRDFERLTLVLGTRSMGGVSVFSIDPPSGFREAAEGLQPWRMRFEFTGEDRLLYIFHTLGGQTVGRDILIPLPPVVERVQRRDSFRLVPPAGSYLSFKAGKELLRFSLVNLSLGGALAIAEKRESAPLLEEGQIRSNVDLTVIIQEDDVRQVMLEEITMVRTFVEPQTGRIHYGFRFSILDRDERALLRNTLTELQRVFLQKRNRI